MSDPIDDDRSIIESLVNLTADITEARNEADAKRLRSVLTSVARKGLRDKHRTKIPIAESRLHKVVPEALKAELLKSVEEGKEPELPQEVVHIARRDEREILASGTLVDNLSGLAPSERLGPFMTAAGINIWFDVFLLATRLEVREKNVAAPAFVFSKARNPTIAATTTTIEIDAGTVWIRGNLISGALPLSAYVGIKVSGGTLKLSQNSTFNNNIVEIVPPPKGTLSLKLANDTVTPVDGACTAANTKVVLPDSLSFKFDSGSSTAKGGPGSAEAWGQEFNFDTSNGTWTFVPTLFTVALGYDVNPPKFDADPIGDDLVRFEGKANITNAGLGLPVVVAADPSILGEAAHGATWLLQADELSAQWYASDRRFHQVKEAWIEVAPAGARIVAAPNAALTPPVTHTIDLWALSGSSKRLPWRQTYSDTFALLYSCHVVDGEMFLVSGRAQAALDRPVTTDGAPVPGAGGNSVLMLKKFKDTITAFIGAFMQADNAVHQFALSNALVWTTGPAFIVVKGDLINGLQVDIGTTQITFAAFAWAPTLPDPYVSNATIRAPRFDRGIPLSLLIATVEWNGPERVGVSFQGDLVTNVALQGRQTSPNEPRPFPPPRVQPDVGLTQVEQDQLTFNEREAADWKTAQAFEQHGRPQRVGTAQAEDSKSVQLIDRFTREIIGPTPLLTLLDVSTNQDLLGVAVGGRSNQVPGVSTTQFGAFSVSGLAVQSQVGAMNVVTLPQVQWEPVRTLDADQDIMTMGWFPTPLASATDGGATRIGARSQKLMPIIPEFALKGTFEAYRDGIPVGIRTTFPFGLIAAIQLQPNDTPPRRADLYRLTRPVFPSEQSRGGIQITAHADGGRPDNGGLSPTFNGVMRQLLNGVDLPSGAPLGISVLGSTGDPLGSVEKVFNDDMASRPRVPVKRIDLSGYGGSNFSDWNNPFAAFAEAAKVQFQLMIGRTLLEVIKVNSVLHPWGIRVTRSITIERRPGGGVIRRDSGWQAFTPGIFDYRYIDPLVNPNLILIAPYKFDAGVFRGLFNVRTIRPAPGEPFSASGATLIPYYFDADLALEGVPGRTSAVGILGYLQTQPNGAPASANAIKALIEQQGPIGGPIDTWMDFGGSGLPFRAQRVEVGLADETGTPLFVATVRGVPRLPETGAWSVVVRPVANVPVNGGEAVPVAENRGVPVIRRYPVQFPANDTVFTEPPLAGVAGDYRLADAADLLVPAAPANDYGLLQSTPTHAFLFPRPFVPASSPPRIQTGHKPALADLFARSSSKGAFPPATNTIELGAGAVHFNVGATGKLALSTPISILGHPIPLRIAGTNGHGSRLFYDTSTLNMNIEEERWQAEFTGLQVWSDISGLERLTGSEMRVVGSTEQRSQIAEIRSLLLQDVEQILQYIPIFGQRGVQGPVDLGMTNAKHEFKVEVLVKVSVPPPTVIATFPAGSGVVLTLFVKQSTGIDLATGGAKASATFGANLEGKIPVLSVGVATVFIIIAGEITFSLTSVSGAVTAEKLDLMAFVGVGVEGKIGPFKAYAFLGIGFLLTYDAIANVTKYGGIVALEAGVDLVIVKVKIRAELKGLVYDDAGVTKCDYSGSVKINVDIFLIISISASYTVSDTKALS